MYSEFFQRLLRSPAVALVRVNVQLLCSFCHLDLVLGVWVMCSIQIALVVWGLAVQVQKVRLLLLHL